MRNTVSQHLVKAARKCIRGVRVWLSRSRELVPFPSERTLMKTKCLRHPGLLALFLITLACGGERREETVTREPAPTR